MNKDNIFIETLYEFKRTRRSILFHIFITLAILGLIFYQFTFLSKGNDAISIKKFITILPRLAFLGFSFCHSF